MGKLFVYLRSVCGGFPCRVIHIFTVTTTTITIPLSYACINHLQFSSAGTDERGRWGSKEGDERGGRFYGILQSHRILKAGGWGPVVRVFV